MSTQPMLLSRRLQTLGHLDSCKRWKPFGLADSDRGAIWTIRSCSLKTVFLMNRAFATHASRSADSHSPRQLGVTQYWRYRCCVWASFRHGRTAIRITGGPPSFLITLILLRLLA